MKIGRGFELHRNDFYCTYECEHCGAETDRRSGYNDSFFHEQVIPAKHCDKCGKNRAGDQKEIEKKVENCK